MLERGEIHSGRESGPRRETDPLEGSPEVRWLRERNPLLEDVRFAESDDPTFEGGRFGLPDDADARPKVSIADGGAERFAKLKESRKGAVEAMARTLGIPFDELDGETIRQFILFHEAGHALDYVKNFLVQAVDIHEANDEWQAVAQDQLNTLPFPDASPAELREEIADAGGFEAWRARNADDDAWCKERGISSEQELLAAQEGAYRALDKESYADDFAKRMVGELRKLTAS